MNIIRRIKRVIKRETPEIETMRYCYANGFKSGKDFSYNTGYPIDANFPWLITVGDNVTLATGVKLLAHDASTAKIIHGEVNTKVGRVDVGNNVFIGANSIVLCNTRIGDNVIIGAGSVVTHDVPSNSVYAGNPAKYVCSFAEFEQKHIDNQLDCPTFHQHKWYEWRHASEKEKSEMKDRLKDTFGYL